MREIGAAPQEPSVESVVGPVEPVPIEGEGYVPTSLWEKLIEVAAQCSYVQKGGTNIFHKYNYATAADVFEKVSHALYAVGLASWTETSIHDWREKATKSGSIDNLVTVQVKLHVVNPESKEEVVTVSYGSGMDNGDKAVMKAQTAALKYAWMMMLNISTGDDPEGDEKVDQRQAGAKAEKVVPRGAKTGDFTAADKELARQAQVDGKPFIEQLQDASADAAARFGTPRVCKKCGNALGDYTSHKGEKYSQCIKAHSDWEAARKMGIEGDALKAISKGHTWEKQKVADLSDQLNQALAE